MGTRVPARTRRSAPAMHPWSGGGTLRRMRSSEIPLFARAARGLHSGSAMKRRAVMLLIVACASCGGKTGLEVGPPGPRIVGGRSSSTEIETQTFTATGSTKTSPLPPPPASTSVGVVSTTRVQVTASTTTFTNTASLPSTWVETTGPGLGNDGLGICSLPLAAEQHWIAFDSDRIAGNRDIYLVRVDGSQLVRFTTDSSAEKEPAISHDGTRMAFSSDRTGVWEIYVMNLSTLQVVQLTSYPQGADQPNWAADDKRLAFHSGASVYLMGSDGSGARVVGTGLDNFNAYENPSLTPDGAQVVFDRRNELDALDLSGSGFRYVVQNTTTTIETPSVEPNGMNVAFGALVTATAEQIAIAPLDGTTAVQTAELWTPAAFGSARKPAWGPSSVIAFEHGAPGAGQSIASAAIAVSPAPGATPCDLVRGPGDNRDPSWAPDGWQP